MSARNEQSVLGRRLAATPRLDPVPVTRTIELAYRAMWQAWCVAS